MELVFAGFGGQGVLTSGLIIAEMAIAKDLNVTWMPSYGPSMRGGKAYSVVKYSDKQIGGPDIEETDILVAMNKPSLDLAVNLKSGGLLVVNADAVDAADIPEGDFEVVSVPCIELAQGVNNIKAANIVTIGAIVKNRKLFDVDEAKKVLRDMFEKQGKGKFADANEAAFMAGYDYL